MSSTSHPPSADPRPGMAGTPPAGTVPGASSRLDAMSAALARNWWLLAIRGVVAILFGAIAFLAPEAFVLSLVLFFAAYMVVDGIVAIVAAVRAAQRHERWGLMLVEGIVDIVVGVVAVLMPGAAVLSFVLLVAVWALLTGALAIGAAFRLHRHYGRWWLGLGGAVSILFGLALLVNPGMSALVLTWWIGAYALAFGVLLLILAFQLRGRHGTAATAA